jgi:uncharacterized membrane protein YgcG
MAELNDSSVDGRSIKVVEARPKDEKSSFRGNGGNGGSSSGGGFKKRW